MSVFPHVLSPFYAGDLHSFVKNRFFGLISKIVPQKYYTVLVESTNKMRSELVIKKIVNGDDPLDLRDKQILKHIDDGCKSVLVVGPGGGRKLFYLAFNGFDVTGVEISVRTAYFLKKMKIRYLHDHQNVKIDIGNIYNLVYPNDSFDVVLCSEVIEHLESPKKGIDELYRVAKKYIIVTTPWMYSFNSPGHIHHFNDNDIDSLFCGKRYRYRKILTKDSDAKKNQSCYLIVVEKSVM